MIITRDDLKEYLDYEKALYNYTLIELITGDQKVYNWKFIRLLRKCEYYYNNRKSSAWHKFCYIWYRRRKNILGVKIGVEIWENSFGKGLLIHHNGSIVVNRDARIGENCQLHGDNCIGNSGRTEINDVPKLGSNVDIGVGAKIIGNVVIANGIKVGANAVVTKSFSIENSTIIGIPAHLK